MPLAIKFLVTFMVVLALSIGWTLLDTKDEIRLNNILLVIWGVLFFSGSIGSLVSFLAFVWSL